MKVGKPVCEVFPATHANSARKLLASKPSLSVLEGLWEGTGLCAER